MLGKLEGSLAVALHRVALNEKLLERKWWTLSAHPRRVAYHSSDPHSGLQKIERGCLADRSSNTDAQRRKLQDAVTVRYPAICGRIVGAFKL
jgi:hypothetical protein